MRKCPRCGLLSPDRSVRCECGLLFDVDDRAAVVREHRQWQGFARAHLFGGIALFGLGAVMSIASYLIATERGGSYAIWVGLMVAGGALAVRATVRMRAIRDAEKPLE